MIMVKIMMMMLVMMVMMTMIMVLVVVTFVGTNRTYLSFLDRVVFCIGSEGWIPRTALRPALLALPSL